MSMTDALPIPADRPRLIPSVYAWEAAKTVFAVVTFAALLLPVAYPSKAGTQTKPAQVSAIEAPQATAKVQASSQASRPGAGPAQASAQASTKSNGPQVPAKKPVPKNT